MDLLADPPEFDLYDPAWRIYSVNPVQPPHYLAATAKVTSSIINEGCQIFGEVEHSVVFPGVYIGAGTKVTNSVIMPDVKIEADVIIDKAIIGRNAFISAGSCVVGGTVDGQQEIVVVAEDRVVLPETEVQVSGKGM